MYVALGDPLEPIFEFFQLACKQQGEKVIALADLGEKARFSWRFDSDTTSSAAQLADSSPFGDHEVKGVLVQKPPRLDADVAPNAESERLQMEKNAILIAWCWSLPCPVINRYPTAFWFAPSTAQVFWEPLLTRCGLALPDTILSNVEAALRRFAADLGGNICYSPFCDSQTYRITGQESWAGLNKMRVNGPVRLVSFTPPVYRACVVGQQIFWDRTVPDPLLHCEDQLKQLAALAGLDFIEVRLIVQRGDLGVLAVEAFPDLKGFSEASLREIAGALVAILQSPKPLHSPIAEGYWI